MNHYEYVYIYISFLHATNLYSSELNWKFPAQGSSIQVKYKTVNDILLYPMYVGEILSLFFACTK